MQIRLIAVGNLKEKWLREAYSEYEKRLGRYCKFQLIELPESRLPEMPAAGEIGAALAAEGKRILQQCRGKVIAMCIEGKQLSSEQFAAQLQRYAQAGDSTISIVIGSSYGLHDTVKAAADMKLSLSPMTFTHQIARVLMTEQIYRAFQISSGGKYHK